MRTGTPIADALVEDVQIRENPEQVGVFPAGHQYQSEPGGA